MWLGFCLLRTHVFVCDSFVIHGIQAGRQEEELVYLPFLRRTNVNLIAILQNRNIFLHETTKWQIYFDLMPGWLNQGNICCSIGSCRRNDKYANKCITSTQCVCLCIRRRFCNTMLERLQRCIHYQKQENRRSFFCCIIEKKILSRLAHEQTNWPENKNQ